MSLRYSGKDAEEAFRLLCAALDWRIATDHGDNDGRYFLDHNPYYGGCVIREIVIRDGHRAEYEPFGLQRRNAREFCEWTHTLRQGMDLIAPDLLRKRTNAYYQAQHDAEEARQAAKTHKRVNRAVTQTKGATACPDPSS